MTKSGAQKMMQLIQEKGVFTSGDHMIVNHGEYFNIYFTTPLLTECMQEEDPVYIKSDFNNYGRLDTFDSDLWNNNDHFSQEEITKALAVHMRHIDIKVVKEPISEAERQRLNEEHQRKLEQPTPQPIPHETMSGSPKEQTIKVWNDFLRAVAMRKSEEVASMLPAILGRWKTHQDILNEMSWFRIFEQLILTDHPEIIKHKQTVIAFIQGRKDLQETIWTPILKHLGIGDLKNQNIVVSYALKEEPRTPVFYLEGIKPLEFFEHEWLNRVFPSPIEWKPLTQLQPMFEIQGIPVLLYMNLHDRSMTPAVQTICNVFQQVGRKFVLLHISDEYGRDDISMYDHPAIHKVVRNYWRPHLSPKAIVLPLGYAKGRSGYALPEPPAFADRPYMWSFAGSLDRPGRDQALSALRTLHPHLEQTKQSWSSPMKVEGPDYIGMLRKSKFVPCMKGSVAMESFRLYEALEHGAIPFYVPSESHNCADEYREVFGSLPILAVPSWSDAATYLAKLADRADLMELHRKEVYHWWQQKKQEYAETIKQVLNSA
jgi:hypothetical protein